MITTTNDAQAIDEVRQLLQAAENAGDANAAAALMADDVVVMVPDFEAQEGKEACVAFLHDVLGWLFEHFERRITYTSAEVTVVGELAFDRGTFAFSVTPKAGGATTETTGKYLWLLRRTDGAWKVTRMIVCRDGEGEGASVDPNTNPLEVA
jgi:uncharacterized protein (TIGR02246 family)